VSVSSPTRRASPRAFLAALSLGVWACSGSNGRDGASTDLDATGGTGGTSGESTSANEGSTDSGPGSTSDAPGTTTEAETDGAPTEWVPSLVERSLLCKLISNTGLDDPTDNQTHTRFNLRGSDLGVPVVSDGVLYLFFGDTVGYRVIWDFGEDPDSVARIDHAAVQADPTEVCRNLDFYVTPDVPSVAHGVDPTIERDFAGAYMIPPAGESISDYIAQPAATLANMPGTFEVPAGGLAHDGRIFLFYAGRVELQPVTRATLGYLARWDAPPTTAPTYQIVRPIDALVDGPLGGHFIQVAPVFDGRTIHLFGTGDYRRSGVYLARLDLAALESGEGQALYDAATGTWFIAESASQAEREAVAPVFEVDGVGEISVVRVDEADVLVALYQRELRDDAGSIVDNRVLVRVATTPEGPWSEAVTIVDMADPVFRDQHCCDATCQGDQVLNCNLAGLYGACKRSHPLGCRIPAPKPDLAEQGTWSWSWSWSWS
jgi:hypothetical protein